MIEQNTFKLSRIWFDFCFENPEIIKPNHTALYFFCIEHCNRLGWKDKFGLPTTMAKEAIGISSYNTYINTLNDLIRWGFIKLIQKSTNQYSSNIIALSNYNKALNKALDKALIKHDTKQSESIDSINKQINKGTSEHSDIPPTENFKQFYQREISENENAENIHEYKLTVNYLLNNPDIGGEVKHILNVKNQLKFSQFQKLINEHGFERFKEKMKVWVNNKKYSKDKQSVYLTLNNWCNQSTKNHATR